VGGVTGQAVFWARVAASYHGKQYHRSRKHRIWGIPSDSIEELGTNPSTSGVNHAPVGSYTTVLVPPSRFVVT